MENLLTPIGKRFVDELLTKRCSIQSIYMKKKKKLNSKNVYLDISFMHKKLFKKRFPNIYEKCLENGIDITKEPIPVSPAQHYFMGGIDVDSSEKLLWKIYMLLEK